MSFSNTGDSGTTHQALAWVLASGSPRRRELLQQFGLQFKIRPPDLDETVRIGEIPLDYVVRLASAKAQSVARPGELVVAADTAVVCDQEILGKPQDDNDAHRMLKQLSGRQHEVVTGVAVARWLPLRTQELASTAVVTRVRFSSLSAPQRNWYVATGEGTDKAGGYGIQGLGGLFVESIDGSYSNVVGLPLGALETLLHGFGMSLLTQP